MLTLVEKHTAAAFIKKLHQYFLPDTFKYNQGTSIVIIQVIRLSHHQNSVIVLLTSYCVLIAIWLTFRSRVSVKGSFAVFPHYFGAFSVQLFFSNC